MNLYVGTSGFSYKEWKGRFYPPDLPSKQLLRFYSSHFRAVEINNTFYRMPKEAILEAWASEVPEGFRFALKAPRQITHLLQLRDAAEPVGHLLQISDSLGGTWEGMMKHCASPMQMMPCMFPSNLQLTGATCV